MSLLGKSTPTAVVGLDIGSNLIKVVEARLGKNAISLSGMGVAPVPEGVIEGGVVIDPQGLGLAVKRLLADSGIKARAVVSSISNQSSLVVRIIEMPKMSPKELGEAMKFEVERQTPFAPSEVIMDYAPIEKPSTPPDAQQMEVLLAAAQQDTVNNHVETLFAAGLKPLAIDIEPLAASRALIDALDNGVKNATVGIVNIGANKTEVAIFEGGLLTFPSPPLQIAGINLTRAISEALGETIEKAEILKKQFAEVDLSRIDTIASDMGGADIGFGTMGQAEEPDYSSPIPFIGASDPGPTSQAPPPAPAAGPLSSPFDFGEPEQPSDQSAAFKDTVDGPVFDVGGDNIGTAPVKPSFDLSDDMDDSPPAQSASRPVLDLDEPEAAPAGEPTAFHFDLGNESEAEVSGTGEPKPAGTAADSFDISGPAPADMGAELSGTGEPRPIGAEPASVSGTHAPGALSSDEEKKQRVFEAMAPVLLELAAELRRSIEYYRTRFQNQPEKIFITGGTAKIRNLDKFLTNELGISVEVGDPVANLPVTSARYSEQYLREVSPLFTVSVGLAIRDML